jgi:hypothetical protein
VYLISIRSWLSNLEKSNCSIAQWKVFLFAHSSGEEMRLHHDLLVETLSFLSRHSLSGLTLVNRYLHDLVEKQFRAAPLLLLNRFHTDGCEPAAERYSFWAKDALANKSSFDSTDLSGVERKWVRARESRLNLTHLDFNEQPAKAIALLKRIRHIWRRSKLEIWFGRTLSADAFSRLFTNGLFAHCSRLDMFR